MLISRIRDSSRLIATFPASGEAAGRENKIGPRRSWEEREGAKVKRSTNHSFQFNFASSRETSTTRFRCLKQPAANFCKCGHLEDGERFGESEA
ncbi:MAG: hypothetical protein DWI22_03380 [Planctomycetota bacterium]|nr:MAG: hypothetical protein DWI22_03380 [Planctomycetota bacterium]